MSAAQTHSRSVASQLAVINNVYTTLMQLGVWWVSVACVCMCVSALQLNTACCIVLAGTLCSTQCQPDGKTMFCAHTLSHRFVLKTSPNTKRDTLFLVSSFVHSKKSYQLLPCSLVAHALNLCRRFGSCPLWPLHCHHKCSTVSKQTW